MFFLFLCLSAGHVKSIDCPKTQEHCVPCKSGEEYMDHINDLDECMRCRSCDKALGMSIETATLFRSRIQLKDLCNSQVTGSTQIKMFYKFDMEKFMTKVLNLSSGFFSKHRVGRVAPLFLPRSDSAQPGSIWRVTSYLFHPCLCSTFLCTEAGNPMVLRHSDVASLICSS